MEKVLLRTVSTVEAVSDMLEEDVYSLHYTMGEKIKETELAERYGVSRNTIREAMAHLVSKGLLEKVANKGIYVKEILADDIEDIFRLRELLEEEAIRRIVAKGSVPKRMHVLADNTFRYNPSTECVANRNADIAFHQFIVESAGSPRLLSMYENMLTEVKLCFFQALAFVPGRSENAVQHFKIVQAMEEGDAPRAIAHLSEHITTAIETYKVGMLNQRKLQAERKGGGEN